MCFFLYFICMYNLFLRDMFLSCQRYQILNCFFSTWASTGELLGEKAMGSCCPGELSAVSL